ncbi:MAG: aquaporin [Bdellovibrionota bacterium]|nr:aquaporin [Bdellovibrionota bacterium]
MKTYSIYPAIAEFIGTFFLVFLGCGGIVLSQVDPTSMSPFIIPFLFGGTVTIMIYSVGHISGAHFNPAVTMAFGLTRKFPRGKIIGHTIGQCLGALLASLLHGLIWGGGHDFGVAASSRHFLFIFGGEILFSFLLMFVIMSVATDTRAVGNLAGLAIGLTVTLCCFIGGPLMGLSMNPARTLGPAVFSGSLATSGAYLLGPYIGAFLGAWTYEKIKCEGDKEHKEIDSTCC